MARKTNGPGKGHEPIDGYKGVDGGSGEGPDRLDEGADGGGERNTGGLGSGDADTDDEEVGYKKPPRRTQFQPGQSGNPRGRKKESRGLKTDLAAELSSIYTTTINRQMVKGTKQQLMLKTLATRAAHGDVKAAATLLSYTIQILGVEDRGSDKARLSPHDQALLDALFSDVDPEAAADQADPDAEAGGAGDGGGVGGGNAPPAIPEPDEPEPGEPGNA